MPAGLQIFDRSGNVMLDMTTPICKFFGSFYVSSNGSVYIPEMASGRGFFVTVPDGSQGNLGRKPVVWSVGGTIYYEYRFSTAYPGAYAMPVYIYYGVY